MTTDDNNAPGYQAGMRMQAYYYGFDFTGVEAIDRILSAVAIAGKAYHSTDSWDDDQDGPSYADRIQLAANAAAVELAPRSAPEPPSIERLALGAELWNALAARVTHRTDRHAVLSVRDRLARQAVAELDRLIDVWLVERGFVVNKCEQCSGSGKTVTHRGPADESDVRLCSRCDGTGRGPIIDSRGPALHDGASS